jgi:hypothetical protein
LNDNIYYKTKNGTVTDITNNVITLSAASAYSTGNGYITLTRNVVTGNVWVTGVLPLVQTIELTDESENSLTTEDKNILLLG